MLTVVLLVVVAAFAVVALANNWDEVRDDLGRLAPVDLLLSGAAAAVGLGFAYLTWRTLLSGLGGHMGTHDSLTVFFAGQLGKYVPGSVWPAVIQAELGRRSEVPRTTMVTSYLLALMVALATGSLVGPLVLLGGARDSLWVVVTAAAIVGAAVAVLLYDARWLNQFTNWAGGRLRRDIPELHAEGRTIVPAALLHVGAWVFLGLHTWLLARPLGAGWDQVVPTIGGFAFAFVAGLVVIPLPAGAGVRDAVLVLMLAEDIGRSGALTVTLLSRLVLVVVELLLAGAFGVRGAMASVRAAGPGRRTPR